MNDEKFQRLKLLIGDEDFSKPVAATVAVFGVRAATLLQTIDG